MGEVLFGFPGVVGVWVSFPFDEVLLTFLFQDLFDFEFVVLLGFVVECHLEWGIQMCWFQQRYVEYWVYPSVLWEVQLVIEFSLLPLDQKWSDLDVIQFLRSSFRLQVLRQKIYLTPLFQLRCRF